MTRKQHKLAMAHYIECKGEAWDNIALAMDVMQPLYEAAPDLLAALEGLINSSLLSVNPKSNRTPQAMALRRKAITAIHKAKGV